MKNEKYVILLIIILLIIAAFLFLYFETNSEKTYSLKTAIISEEDDGRSFEDLTTLGYGNEPSAWANLQINPSYSFGLRFVNINIPKNAEIITSYVKLFSIGNPRHNKVNCMIYGDDIDNAVNFTTKGCLNRSGRSYTENYVFWQSPVYYQAWVQTPSLNNIIQEIIDRADWSKNNAIALLFVTNKTNNTAVFANYDEGNPAELYVEWKK